MQTIVEFATDKIKLLQIHKRKIVRFKEIELDVLDNKHLALVQHLNLLNWKLKKTTFVINNNDVLYREMKLPNIEHKKLKSVIINELKISSATNENYITDFIELSKEVEGKKRILTCSLTQTNMESYISLAEKINCKDLSKVDVGYNSLFQYLEKIHLNDKETTSLMVDIGNRVVKLYLFDEGDFIIVRSVRLSSVATYDQTVTQLLDEISKMHQFNLSRNSKNNMGNIYFFGDHLEITSLFESLKGHTFEGNCEYLPCLDGLLLPQEFNYLNYVYTLGLWSGK